MGDDNRKKIVIALMAQSVEQLTFNQWGNVSSLRVRVPLGAQVYDLVAQLVRVAGF